MLASISGGGLTLPGAVLGIVLFGLLPLLVLGGFGIMLLVRGKAEEADMATVRQQEQLLGMIQAQGQVSLSEVMLRLKLNREELEQMIYQLVNMGIFSGYIDWSKQMLYSAEAGKVASPICPNCGGERQVVGKGLVKCPYCGASLFIREAGAA
jgi:ribosomal protein S27AE